MTDMVEIYYDNDICNDEKMYISREAFSKMHDDICPSCGTETLRMLYVTDYGDGSSWECSHCNSIFTWVG